MKIFFLSIVVLSIFGTKFLVTDQMNQIKKLEKEIFKIDMEIEKLKTDFPYVSSPQKLKNINDNQYKLIPIEQIDIIKIENK